MPLRDLSHVNVNLNRVKLRNVT